MPEPSAGPGGSPEPANVFLVRIVAIDYVLTKPIPGVDFVCSPFLGDVLPRVPVVRIFGSTPSGQKACVHVHRVFPFLYVPYDPDLPRDPKGAASFLQALVAGINRILAPTGSHGAQPQQATPKPTVRGVGSFNPEGAAGSRGGGRGGPSAPIQPAKPPSPPPADVDAEGGKSGPGPPAQTSVFNAVLVRARKFYGFHEQDSMFIKISLLNPGLLSRVASLLQGGAVLGRCFQPYEAHIPFLLQFKVTLNLYGMDWLRLGKVLFRHPLPPAPLATRHEHLTGLGGALTQALTQGSLPVRPHASQGGASHGATPGPAQAPPAWTETTAPSSWQWLGSRDAPARESTCELECDALADDVLNAADTVRADIQLCSDADRLVESLLPMWEQEAQRLGHPPPTPPPDPPRSPVPLGAHQETVRGVFASLNDLYRRDYPHLFTEGAGAADEGRTEDAVRGGEMHGARGGADLPSARRRTQRGAGGGGGAGGAGGRGAEAGSAGGEGAEGEGSGFAFATMGSAPGDVDGAGDDLRCMTQAANEARLEEQGSLQLLSGVLRDGAGAIEDSPALAAGDGGHGAGRRAVEDVGEGRRTGIVEMELGSPADERGAAEPSLPSQGSLTAAAEAAAADEELANVLQWWEQAEERAVDEHAREARDAGGTQDDPILSAAEASLASLSQAARATDNETPAGPRQRGASEPTAPGLEVAATPAPVSQAGRGPAMASQAGSTQRVGRSGAGLVEERGGHAAGLPSAGTRPWLTQGSIDADVEMGGRPFSAASPPQTPLGGVRSSQVAIDTQARSRVASIPSQVVPETPWAAGTGYEGAGRAAGRSWAPAVALEFDSVAADAVADMAHGAGVRGGGLHSGDAHGVGPMRVEAGPGALVGEGAEMRGLPGWLIGDGTRGMTAGEHNVARARAIIATWELETQREVEAILECAGAGDDGVGVHEPGGWGLAGEPLLQEGHGSGQRQGEGQEAEDRRREGGEEQWVADIARSDGAGDKGRVAFGGEGGDGDDSEGFWDIEGSGDGRRGGAGGAVGLEQGERSREPSASPSVGPTLVLTAGSPCDDGAVSQRPRIDQDGSPGAEPGPAQRLRGGAGDPDAAGVPDSDSDHVSDSLGQVHLARGRRGDRPSARDMADPWAWNRWENSASHPATIGGASIEATRTRARSPSPPRAISPPRARSPVTPPRSTGVLPLPLAPSAEAAPAPVPVHAVSPSLVTPQAPRPLALSPSPSPPSSPVAARRPITAPAAHTHSPASAPPAGVGRRAAMALRKRSRPAETPPPGSVDAGTSLLHAGGSGVPHGQPPSAHGAQGTDELGGLASEAPATGAVAGGRSAEAGVRTIRWTATPKPPLLAPFLARSDGRAPSPPPRPEGPPPGSPERPQKRHRAGPGAAGPRRELRFASIPLSRTGEAVLDEATRQQELHKTLRHRLKPMIPWRPRGVGRYRGPRGGAGRSARPAVGAAGSGAGRGGQGVAGREAEEPAGAMRDQGAIPGPAVVGSEERTGGDVVAVDAGGGARAKADGGSGAAQGIAETGGNGGVSRVADGVGQGGEIGPREEGFAEAGPLSESEDESGLENEPSFSDGGGSGSRGSGEDLGRGSSAPAGSVSVAGWGGEERQFLRQWATWKGGEAGKARVSGMRRPAGDAVGSGGGRGALGSGGADGGATAAVDGRGGQECPGTPAQGATCDGARSDGEAGQSGVGGTMDASQGAMGASGAGAGAAGTGPTAAPIAPKAGPGSVGLPERDVVSSARVAQPPSFDSRRQSESSATPQPLDSAEVEGDLSIRDTLQSPEPTSTPRLIARGTRTAVLATESPAGQGMSPGLQLERRLDAVASEKSPARVLAPEGSPVDAPPPDGSPGWQPPDEPPPESPESQRGSEKAGDVEMGDDDDGDRQSARLTRVAPAPACPPPRSPAGETQPASISGPKDASRWRRWVPRMRPPPPKAVARTLRDFGLPDVDYLSPFYSLPSDVPRKPPVLAGVQHDLPCRAPACLPHFTPGPLAMPARQTGVAGPLTQLLELIGRSADSAESAGSDGEDLAPARDADAVPPWQGALAKLRAAVQAERWGAESDAGAAKNHPGLQGVGPWLRGCRLGLRRDWRRWRVLARPVLPPTRREAARWAAEGEEPADDSIGVGAGEGAGWAMDPNTGALLPRAGPAPHTRRPGPGTGGQGSGSQDSARRGSLLGTPSETRSGALASGRCGSGEADTPARVSQTPQGGRRHAHTHRPSRLSLGGTLEGGAGSLEAAAEGSALDPDIDLERPPSPKYDERVDFFFPAAKPRQRRAARRQGGPDTGAGFARRGAAGVAYGADWPRKRLRMSQALSQRSHKLGAGSSAAEPGAESDGSDGDDDDAVPDTQRLEDAVLGMGSGGGAGGDSAAAPVPQPPSMRDVSFTLITDEGVVVQGPRAVGPVPEGGLMHAVVTGCRPAGAGALGGQGGGGAARDESAGPSGSGQALSTGPGVGEHSARQGQATDADHRGGVAEGPAPGQGAGGSKDGSRATDSGEVHREVPTGPGVRAAEAAVDANANAGPRGPPAGSPVRPPAGLSMSGASREERERRAAETPGSGGRRTVSGVSPPSPVVGGYAHWDPASQTGYRRRHVQGKGQGLTVVSVEVHAVSRGALLPDPRYDPVQCVCLAVMEDCEEPEDEAYLTYVLMVDPSLDPHPSNGSGGADAVGAAAPSGAAGGGGDGAPSPAHASHGAEAVDAGVAGSPPRADCAVGGSGDVSAPPGALHRPQTRHAARAAAARHVAACGPGVQGEVLFDERALLDRLVEHVREVDPDVVVGFEVQGGSLGYLIDRAATLGTALVRELSRTPEGRAGHLEKRDDEYGRYAGAGIHLTGRVVFNLWRILTGDVKLAIYTFESCVAAVLRMRVPRIDHRRLHAWFLDPVSRWRTVEYFVRRARLDLALLEKLDTLGRTGEMARAFGIDFESVITRGSQYRVESMLMRVAHTQNYLLLSASREQVANQPAMECLPLVMEPESRLHSSPVVVLDFQSLYPSMVIAYNLCFSTCIGRPSHYRAEAGVASKEQPLQVGARLGALPRFSVPAGSLVGGLDPSRLIVAPNGVAFAPPEVRKGVLPRLVSEILDTRVMVKTAMKGLGPRDRILQRCFNARQFSLKLIANVIYGYTAAGFSGRMPMAELADAIVQSGRATLEAAIAQVNAHPDWRARVVYGDTDSMFVLLEGRSREEAHRIGEEIAAAITAMSPPPVKLKFEKVYLPCILQTKKRYVGHAYESPKQSSPIFDAKGIETVRRDSCPAVAKILESSLRLIFDTKDLSEVKAFLARQFSRILHGRVNLQDFVFAKEVRLGTYSAKAAAPPPAAIVAAKRMARDPRAEPKYAERVPYVVVYGAPGARLVDLVVPPQAVVESRGQLRLHALYYITKQILPALERVLSLVGADVQAWFAGMPRPARMLPHKRPAASLAIPQVPEERAGPGVAGQAGGAREWVQQGTIDAYYLSRHCVACDRLTRASEPVCRRCARDTQASSLGLVAGALRLQQDLERCVRVCVECGGTGGDVEDWGIACVNESCAVYFERAKKRQELAVAERMAEAGLRALSSLE